MMPQENIKRRKVIDVWQIRGNMSLLSGSGVALNLDVHYHICSFSRKRITKEVLTVRQSQMEDKLKQWKLIAVITQSYQRF